jgi:cysteine desulfurase
MTKPSTYLDFNATAPVRPEVADAVAQIMILGGNPSSVHGLGRKARAAVEEARRKLAAFLHAKPNEIIFTGGGTEANTLALKGVIQSHKIERLLVTTVEHPSVRDLANAGDLEVTLVPVDKNGLVDAQAFATQLEGNQKTLVSIMLANNETGVVQPIEDLTKIAKAAGAFVHCDGVQAAGKIDVDFEGFGVDLLSISAHKFAGPQGVGALVLKAGLTLAPLTHGGGQELGRRSGTENVAGIVGFGLAAEISQREMGHNDTLAVWRDGLESHMRAVAPEVVVFGAAVRRLPNTSLVALPNVAAETQVIQMDLAGFAVSSGSACSSGKVSKSHVLEAMGVSEELAGSALRLSMGWSTTEQDVNTFFEVWVKMRNRLSKFETPSEEVHHVTN